MTDLQLIKLLEAKEKFFENALLNIRGTIAVLKSGLSQSSHISSNPIETQVTKLKPTTPTKKRLNLSYDAVVEFVVNALSGGEVKTSTQLYEMYGGNLEDSDSLQRFRFIVSQVANKKLKLIQKHTINGVRQEDRTWYGLPDLFIDGILSPEAIEKINTQIGIK